MGLGCGYELWDICLEIIMTRLRVLLVAPFAISRLFFEVSLRVLKFAPRRRIARGRDQMGQLCGRNA